MRSAPERLGPLATARVEAMIEEVRLDYEAFFLRALARGEVRGDFEPRVAAAYLDTQAGTVLRQMAVGKAVDVVRAQAQLAFGALQSVTPER